ncbi:MAG: acyl-CoA dehydratase activase-related protein [Clostridia bacterium]|nr:acyl-CoA dehydratase activase-related protein [Clostridia bacterium]
MIVTFPHMGNVYVLVKTLFDEMGVEYIIPPKCNKRTLELGTKYAPEMACLPLKINIGNFIESIEQGADTIIITGGCGPCRFGYYAEMHKEILAGLGYNVEIITLEVNEKGIPELLCRLKRMIGGRSVSSLALPMYKAMRIQTAADKLEELSFRIRPREIRKGSTDAIMQKYFDTVKTVYGAKAIAHLIEETRNLLLSTEIDKDYAPIKIGIVGEIYTLIEPFTNLDIEKMLGNMGVEVNRSLYISHWIKEHIILGGLHMRKKQPFEREAEPYLKTAIGGHAQETLGNTVLYAKQHYDGAIQIYPLTCMPEIVAGSIMPSVTKDYDIPVLTLVMDEITGEAGYITRIDAFVDMLRRRRQIKEANNELVLSGH